MTAGPTYTPIATTTISGSSTTEVTYNSIGGYTDLICVMNLAPLANVSAVRFKFNGDTGSNYSYIQLSGRGGGNYQSTHDSNQSSGLASGALANTTDRLVHTMYINNYANTNMYKNLLGKGSRGVDGTLAAVSLCISSWRSTAAITSFTVNAGSEILPANSTVTLYGILKA